VIAGQIATRGGDASFDLVGGLDDGPDDFLSRERALLGDDADLFASSNDKLATVEDDDDDLLGGSTSFQANVGGEEISGFESSFPAIDTSNEVRQTVCLAASACPLLPPGRPSQLQHRESTTL
jgi:hypothetical protein